MAERKARGGILLRRWGDGGHEVTPLGQLVHLVDVAAPGLPEPLGQQRDPADRGRPPDRRPGRVGVDDRALVAPELLGAPLQLDPHGLAVREVQPAAGQADLGAGAVPAGPDGPVRLPGRLRVGPLQVQPEPGAEGEVLE